MLSNNINGWLEDVFDCILDMKKEYFSLEEIYNYESKLSKMHPRNHNIKAKIRQALQLLRAKSKIEFINNNGKYRISENFIFPDSSDTDTCIEGAKTTVQVNKYERSSVARQKCIDVNGCYCHICELNFSERYGEVGKNFIHVHHKIPLNEISEEYVVDPVNDLIPVCPNCHAMLHRKINDNYLSIEELKAIVNK